MRCVDYFLLSLVTLFGSFLFIRIDQIIVASLFLVFSAMLAVLWYVSRDELSHKHVHAQLHYIGIVLLGGALVGILLYFI